MVSVSFSNSLVTLIGDYSFAGCTSLNSFIIPDSVKMIQKGAFYNCSSLVSAVIPLSVDSIEDRAFYNCIQLTSLYVFSDTPVILPSSEVFYGVDKSACTLHVPVSSIELFKSADVWKEFLKIEGRFPTSVEKICIDKILIYPNPANETLTIESANQEVATCQLYNSTGELLKTLLVENGINTFNISELKSGVYFIQFQEKGKSFVQKLVKY